MVPTGRIVGATEAHAMGLLTEIVPRGAHVDRALALAAGLARLPQETMLAGRRATFDGLGLTPSGEGRGGAEAVA